MDEPPGGCSGRSTQQAEHGGPDLHPDRLASDGASGEARGLLSSVPRDHFRPLLDSSAVINIAELVAEDKRPAGARRGLVGSRAGRRTGPLHPERTSSSEGGGERRETD